MIKLQILNLQGTNLGTKGADYLLSAFADCVKTLHIMDLDISRNEICFESTHIDSFNRMLSNQACSLENLNISNNQLGDDMMSKLAPHLAYKISL